MKKITVLDAIIEIFKDEPKHLSVIEITKKIENQNLYQFNSSNIQGIISNTLRRHCEGSPMSKSRKIVFKKDDSNRYFLK